MRRKGSIRRTGRPCIARACALLAALVAAAPLASQPAPDELLESAESSLFPESFRATVALVTREGGRTTSRMELELTYRQGTGSYMEVTAPARSRGLRFLQREETLWMYNSRAGGGRALRVSPRASFQGSTFSNRDLSDPQFAEEYTVELGGSETISHADLGQVATWVLDATARDEETAYARIRLWVAQESRLLLRTHYFAKSGLLFKTADYRGIRELAGARRPTIVEMRDRQQSDLVSTMELLELEAAPDLPDRLFTERHLTR